MATDKQVAANRRNARRSTGPRSRAGRKRSSQNSFRHGLAAAAAANTERSKRIERLARKIADASTNVVTLEYARTIAQGQFDLAQIARLKVALMSRIGAFEITDARAVPIPDASTDTIRETLSELVKLDRYERRAAFRRAQALHHFLEKKTI